MVHWLCCVFVCSRLRVCNLCCGVKTAETTQIACALAHVSDNVCVCAPGWRRPHTNTHKQIRYVHVACKCIHYMSLPRELPQQIIGSLSERKHASVPKHAHCAPDTTVAITLQHSRHRRHADRNIYVESRVCFTGCIVTGITVNTNICSDFNGNALF